MSDPSNDADAQPSGRVTWSEHYAAGDTPWDLGAPHPELSTRLQDGRLAPPHAGASALVPGAGRAHDALALARRGWRVTALDLVAELGSSVAPALERLEGTFIAGNALEFQAKEPFDLIWDDTFFCAIEPSERVSWGRRAAELLRPGGRYAALVFPVGKPVEEGGPPHGMDEAALAAALGPLFRVQESGPVSRAVPKRTWREHWLVAERSRLSPAESRG